MDRNLYFYEYVERQAESVAGQLKEHAERLLQAATDAAVTATDDLAVRLHVQVAGLEVGKDVTVRLGQPEVEAGRARIPINWRAASQSSLFPSLDAELLVEPLSNTIPLCQLSLVGRYRPPLSLVGALGDAVVGHRLAEAAVRNFVRDLAHQLETEAPG